MRTNQEESPGERQDFEDFVRVAIDPLRGYLRRRVDAANAEDVLSETLLVCWRRRWEAPRGREAVPWSMGVARGCLRNAARASRRRERLAARVAVVDPPRPVGGPESTPETDQDEQLEAALGRLRPAELELVRLWAWDQLQPAEIAAVLGLSPNAVSIRLHRVRKKLAAQLRKSEPLAGHEQAEGGER